MGGEGDSGGRGRVIGAGAKAAFVEALRNRSGRAGAAAAAGFTLDAFYKLRRRDPAFAAAWRGALDGLRGETRIVPNNRRALQRRRLHNVRFDDGAREAFLVHFAWSCDARAAAAEAGVCEATVYNHRRNDPAFAEAFDAALDQGYARLEAEALRQRLAAQQRLRTALEGSGEASGEGAGGGGGEGSGPAVPADIAAEFERILKLLARRDRKPRSPERTGGRRRIWTFEAAIELLDRRLKALSIAVEPLPPEIAARYDAAGPLEPAPAAAPDDARGTQDDAR